MKNRDKKFFRYIAFCLIITALACLALAFFSSNIIGLKTNLNEIVTPVSSSTPPLAYTAQEDSTILEKERSYGILQPFYLKESFFPTKNEFYDEYGQSYQFRDYDNNLIILYFWASWCAACNQELASLERLQQDMQYDKIEDLAIIPLSIDQRGVYEINNYYDSLGLNNLHIFHDAHKRIMNDLKVHSLPTTFIINKKGQVMARITQHLDWTNPQLVHELMTLKGEDTAYIQSQELFSKRQKYRKRKENNDKSSEEDIINSIRKKTIIIN